jgi:hypothetical protein
VAGGDVPPDKAIDSAELYDPVTKSWTATASLRATGNTRYDNITATLLQDGTVLVARSSSVELYDPATGTWTAAGDKARPGQLYDWATPLLDGTVLLAGGRNGVDAAETAEVYDPVIRSWNETGSMLRTPRSAGGDASWVSATPLLDGTVLVAGGFVCSEAATGCPTGATGSAELYVPAGVSPPPAVANLIPIPDPTPTPVATPTPFPPAAGPVPPGARPWKVRVTNRSSEPAAFFLAEEDESGRARLCGSVTPNVVPAGATETVTFQLPSKRVKTCWIWVNPVPGEGGSFFQTSDAPLKGGFLIDEGGQEMWGGAP